MPSHSPRSPAAVPATRPSHINTSLHSQPSSPNQYHDAATASQRSLSRDRRPSIDSPLSGYHSQDSKVMDDIFLSKVPLGKLKILPAKQNKTKAITSPINRLPQISVTDPHAVIHTQHVKYNPITRVYEGLPKDWEPKLQQQFGLGPDQLETIRFPEYKSRIPSVLVQLKKHLIEEHGLSTEGIFRIAPDGEDLTYQKQKINEGRWDGCNDVHIISGLIKIWFRELPVHLLDGLPIEKVSSAETEDACAKLIGEMKEPYASCLLWLLDLCVDIAANASVNKMTSKNLGIVMGPNLFTPNSEDAMASLLYSQKVAHFLHKGIEWRAKQTGKKLQT